MLMVKKTLSDLYEEHLLSEAQADEFVALTLKRQQRQYFKDLVQKEAKIVRFRRNIWIGVGASVLLGISIWAYFHRTVAPPAPLPSVIYAQVTPKSIFEQLSAPTSPSSTLLGVHEQPKEDPLQSFKTAYTAKKYADCIEFGAKIASPDSDIQLLFAYCYLQTGNYAKSIALLEKLYAEADTKEEIRWWLGLAHGLAGDSTQMKKYLSQIAPLQHHYPEAQLLLKQ
ncbi:MAG: hypothetical protein RLZZ628_900 [Bacteroidota bacterium]